MKIIIQNIRWPVGDENRAPLKYKSSPLCLLHSVRLHIEDEGRRFIRNVGNQITVRICTALSLAV